MPEEAKKTQKARSELIRILKEQRQQITEEEFFPCKNNVGEVIFPYYRADIVARTATIFELDPMELHGTRRHRNHDEWRDKNIYREYNIPTVRLDPIDILKMDDRIIIKEIESQLRSEKYQQ